MEDLKHLKRLIVELNQTNSLNEKKAILSHWPQCKRILKWTYDPFKQYYLTSTNLKKMAHLNESDFNYTDIYKLLDDLDNRVITGHNAISATNKFILANKAYADVILRIIDRNLKTRADAKLINAVWPGTVPSFEVALAQKYADYEEKVDFVESTWFASHKIDGCRLITIYSKDGTVKFYSRKGKEFFTLDKVAEEIKKKLPRPSTTGGIVLDGEICIVDDKGNENFTDIMKQIRRKDWTIQTPKYKIFDILPLESFEGIEENSSILSKRLAVLNNLKKEGIFDGKILDVVDQIEIRDREHLAELVGKAKELGWEGLMLRNDVKYEGKRTKNLLKVKQFFDEEYVVKDVVMGPIRFIYEGKEKTEEMLSAITIEHKGFPVSVGSGFTIDFRREVYKDPSLILGKTVTVVYFEETTNKKGTISLRFPTVKAIYEKERDV